MKPSSFDPVATPLRTRAPRASHRAYRDRTGRLHYGMDADAKDCGSWLTRCRQWLLRCESLRPDEPAFLLLSLITFDAIATPADLDAAWDAVPRIYRDGETVCLEWCSADGRQDRRVLSAVTVLSWSAQASHETRLATVIDTVMSRVRFGIDPSLQRLPTEVPSSFDQLLDWVRHALLTALSGDLFAHVSGVDPLTAVPRSCLARRRRQLALRMDEAAVDVLPEHADSTMVLMDAMQRGDSEGGAQLIEQIREACRPNPDEPNVVAQRRRMLTDLHVLAAPAAAANQWAAVLLLLWAVDLVRRGTRRKRPLSPYTIEPYIHLALGRLWNALRGLRADELDQLDLWRVYEQILADPGIEPSQRGKAAAALTAFHEFAETVLDVPRLAHALDADMPVLAPRANVVWPHELHWMLDRLADTSPDDRLVRQLEVVVALLMGACVRIQDAWHVHVFGVQIFDEEVVVAIDPLRSAGSGKSACARRQVEIHDPRCRALLSRWHERRLAEGALPRDLLFGDPGEPRRAWRAGATELLLNRWLKAATGDAEIGTHALRHSFATIARAAMVDGDQRKLDRMSTQAGHAATRTTLTNYVHLFELPLRRQLDQAIHALRMTEAQACRLSATRPGWIRKRRQRSASDPVRVAWAAIEERAARVDIPDVASELVFQSPRAPETAKSPAWSFELVLQCLADLAQDRSADQVRLRRGISIEQWHSIDAAVRSWREAQRGGSPYLAENVADNHLPFGEGFARINHEKWRPLLATLRQTTHPDKVRPVCDAWRHLLRGRYLSLAGVATALPLLQWLADSGVRPEQLVVLHQTAHEDSALDAALEAIEAVVGGLPCVHAERPRRGRPPVYLTLRCARVIGNKPSNAGLSMTGLHALLFSAWVWVEVFGDRP
jgi:integrase